MTDPVPTVIIKMWRSDAIVLLDWLSSVDFDRIPFRDPAEKQALLDLFSHLEQRTDLVPLTQEKIADARAEVSSGIGW